jgi:hypothetical protein
MFTEKAISKLNVLFPVVRSKVMTLFPLIVAASFAQANDQLLLTSLYRSMDDYCIGKACDERDLGRDWVAEINFNWDSSQGLLRKIKALEVLTRSEKRLKTDLKIAVTDQQQNLLFASDGCAIHDIQAKKWYVMSAELLKRLAPVDARIENLRCGADHVPVSR